jgi:hypothetical protein
MCRIGGYKSPGNLVRNNEMILLPEARMPLNRVHRFLGHPAKH